MLQERRSVNRKEEAKLLPSPTGSGQVASWPTVNSSVPAVRYTDDSFGLSLKRSYDLLP